MRKRGAPFTPGTIVGYRQVVRVIELKRPFVATTYELLCTCGHTTISTHKNLLDPRSQKTGLCRNCLSQLIGRGGNEAVRNLPKPMQAPEPAPKPEPVRAPADKRSLAEAWGRSMARLLTGGVG